MTWCRTTHLFYLHLGLIEYYYLFGQAGVEIYVTITETHLTIASMSGSVLYRISFHMAFCTRLSINQIIT